MSKIVPTKNIASALVDVKSPNATYEYLKREKLVNLTREPIPHKKFKPHKKRRFFAGAVIFAVLIIGTLTSFAFFQFKNTSTAIKTGGEVIANNFYTSLSALADFDTEKAHGYLLRNKAQLETLNDALTTGNVSKFLAFFSSAIPTVKDGITLLGDISTLNTKLLGVTDALHDLEFNGFTYFTSDGNKLIDRIGSLEALIGTLTEKIQNIKNIAASLKSTSPFFDNLDQAIGTQYVKYGSELYALQGFLKNVKDLLGSSSGKHILLLFQNPSEIRPGGGFVGSYADLTVQGGQMINLDVRDIYDPDGQLFEKTIPPQELQSLTENWGARDANWFFDFPSSARAVTNFLEKSKIYSERGEIFNAAIALNIRIIESLLSIIGPVELPEYKLTISADNFLREVQREVESGNDKKAGQPKKILKVLAPMLIERMKSLSQKEEQAFLEALIHHMNVKDLMFFAKDEKMQNFFNAQGVAGSIYELPQGFWGNYIAVVNANIAGGKSDAVIKESINARVDIDTDGGILTDLQITKEHNGLAEKDPWWRATNKDYVFVYANPDASLTTLHGNDPKTIVKHNYVGEGFSVYPPLDAFEATRKTLTDYKAWSLEGFGKTIWESWLEVPAGKKKTIELRYEMPSSNTTIPAEGKEYSFIFERQSGVPSKLSATIVAPIGYRWRESKNPFFTIENTDPPSRLVTTLTLEAD